MQWPSSAPRTSSASSISSRIPKADTTARRSATIAATGTRAASTAIYFLLAEGEVSRWHRVDAAEVWHWHAGAPLALSIAPPDGYAADIRLGADLAAGERPQGVVPPGYWQSAAQPRRLDAGRLHGGAGLRCSSNSRWRKKDFLRRGAEVLPRRRPALLRSKAHKRVFHRLSAGAKTR